MKELTETGKYAVDNQTLRILQSAFVGGFADEIGINKTIRDVYDRCDHVVDTHTAVGFNVYSRYYQRSGDETKTIFVSTASPYKFTASVSDALFGAGYSKGRSHDVLMRELSEESGMPIPESISNLSAKAVLHDKTVAKDQMKSAVMSIIAGDS